MHIRYVVIDNPNEIFGMVGRCGGGYSTIWEDWSDAGRIARDNITREFEEGMNQICGHYDRLEASMLSEGFRNPLIITAGRPLNRPIKLLPPELRPVDKINQLLIAEGTTGGSRLWIAQKHNIPVPCIINDTDNRFRGHRITNVSNALNYYTDKPKLTTGRRGSVIEVLHTAVQHHLEDKWKSEESIRYQRARLWIDVMKKYGYNTQLPGNLLKALDEYEANIATPKVDVTNDF